jgi:hypothetical protein
VQKDERRAPCFSGHAIKDAPVLERKLARLTAERVVFRFRRPARD